ncbi:hypothetical protein U1Q18_009923 [Sarracenia purpurea var. burkii]
MGFAVVDDGVILLYQVATGLRVVAITYNGGFNRSRLRFLAWILVCDKASSFATLTDGVARDGGGVALAKLPSVLRIYRDTVTADMKTAIKTAVADLLPVLLVG